MFGPTRYFIETMVVSEKRTLPVQSGYSVNLTDPDSSSFDFGWSSLGITKTAQNDLENALEQSNKGWYWNFFAAFFVGLTVRTFAFLCINTLNRSKQYKKSAIDEYKNDPSEKKWIKPACIFGGIFLSLIMSFIAILVKRS